MTSSSSLSAFTVLIEPDPSKLDPCFTKQECPLPLEPSDFPKSMSRQAKDIPDTASRLIFEKFVSGKNVYLTINPSMAGGGPTNLLVQMRLEEDDQGGTVPPIGFFALLEYAPRQVACSPTILHDGLRSNVPDYLMDILCQRTAHWLIRQHLSRLSMMQTKLVFDYLLLKGSENSLWKDLYDVAVLRCQWILAERPDTGSMEDSPGYAINKVGEALEAMKLWTQAASVYRQGSQLTDNQEHQAMLLQHAGLALKRNQDYAEAETLYLQSIRLQLECSSSSSSTNHTFNPNAEAVSTHMQNILILYDEWSRGMRDAQGNQLNSVEFQIQVPILALLHHSGWQGNGVRQYIAMGQQFQQMGVLKSEFRNRKKALQRLHEAFTSNTSSNEGHAKFRQLLLDTRDTAVTSRMIPNGAPMQTQQTRKVDKNSARSTLRPVDSADLVKCANCYKILDSPMRCPCHTVHYCDQACQKIHWKAVHKANCPKFGNKPKK
jgi:tetratricopeptide (TPR) repeat protein